MAKKVATANQNLLDAVRPAELDGPLHSAILATYGLSLDQPNFFEHDFLPTMLGIGSVRDRGFVAPVALERKLAETYCALICDAHALAEGARPSLRIDVIPVSRPRHHAKIVLLHRERLVRVIISSANLTDSGYRHQREAAAVLDFRPDGGLKPSILEELVRGWLECLGDAATVPVRDALDRAANAVADWPSRPSRIPLPDIQVVFGGGVSPLWQQFAEAWPRGEPILQWQVCSPFWPGPDSRTSPFESLAGRLLERDASLDQTELEVICAADVPGDRARPVFPFTLLHSLRERNFPITRGQILPVRLEALDNEVPDRKAEGQRALHAKWILLRGPRTAVALIGSANFTNTGLGVSAGANVEAGVLIRCPAELLQQDAWQPPLVEAGAVDWATCASHSLVAPSTEPDDFLDWPAHLRRVDLNIHWSESPAPSGELIISFAAHAFAPSAVLAPADAGDAEARDLVQIATYPEETGGVVAVQIDSAVVRRLLVHRTVSVRWGKPGKLATFPINILDVAKAGLPSVLGARPDEQQLLAYFHGRIGEDDLLLLLEKKAQQMEAGGEQHADSSPPADLQNYLIREFVESLYGLEATLKSAIYSPRALELTLLGEFSPAALAERILRALQSGRRSATAAAFQFVELLRVVSGLPLESSEADQSALKSVLQRTVDRLLSFVATAAALPPFEHVVRDSHFVAYVRASVSPDIASRFLTLPEKPRTPIANLSPERNHAPVS